MKSILPTALETRVKVGRRTYRTRPSVAHVRLAIDALGDDGLLQADRLRLAVWHLYRWPRPRPTQEAVDAAFKLLDEPPAYKPDPSVPQALSLEQDAAMIVTAFRQLYGIDLNKEAATLDWRVFEALLGGITDGTRMGEIMGIRTMKLPRRTMQNGEYIRDIQKLKLIYRITKPTGKGMSFEDGLRQMAVVLASMAGGETDAKAGDRSGQDRPAVPDGAGGADRGAVHGA